MFNAASTREMTYHERLQMAVCYENSRFFLMNNEKKTKG